MSFPDGPLSYLEFQEFLRRIKVRQIIVILSRMLFGSLCRNYDKMCQHGCNKRDGGSRDSFYHEPDGKNLES